MTNSVLVLAQAAEEVGALNNTVAVALIVAGGSLLSTGIVTWATSRREHNRQEREAEVRRDEKREDWKRQDLVAQRAEFAAAKVSQVADQAAYAAKLLVERQDAAEEAARLVAEAAKQAARDLVAANERLAKETARSASVVNGKLDQIHTLVNSNLSAAMEDRLTAVRALIVALKQADDKSKAAVDRIDALEATAIELEAQLSDRKRQTKVAEAQVEQGKAGGLKAEWDADESRPEDESS